MYECVVVCMSACICVLFSSFYGCHSLTNKDYYIGHIEFCVSAYWYVIILHGKMPFSISKDRASFAADIFTRTHAVMQLYPIVIK